MADDTYGLDAVITDKTGATTTVRSLLDLAFWFDLEPGQTEEHDKLRLHLLSAHRNLVATLLTDDEALQQHHDEHHDEHHGPGGIRNHDPASTEWDETRCHNLFVDAQLERQAAGDYDDEDDSSGAAFSAHVERLREPGQARTKPWKTAPKTYEEATRYTISVLPPDDPWRRHFQIHVSQVRMDADEWTVGHLGEWAHDDGTWSPAVGERPTFPLEVALELARRLAPSVETNDRTALDVLNLPREGRR